MIYLDNAATANPKAPGVADAMASSLTTYNANPGHGGHKLAVATTVAVFAARAQLAALFGVQDPARLVFTSGATAALNLAIWGSLGPRPAHVICSTWEHNAVLRPLFAWRQRTGGRITVLPATADAPVDLRALEGAITRETALIVLNAASNVTGVLNPVVEAGEIARSRGIRFLVDGSQVAGHIPLRLDDLPLDLWACPGHKGLLGPQGVGLLYIRPGIELTPLIYGGAGFDSARETLPDAAPERYEAGTINTPGILGLGAAATYLLAEDWQRGRRHERQLLRQLLGGLSALPNVRLFSARQPTGGIGVVSLTVAGWSPGQAADALDQRFGICVRSGLHCAPLAHAALGTAPHGTVRISVGPFTTSRDIEATVDAVRALSAHEPRAFAPAGAAGPLGAGSAHSEPEDPMAHDAVPGSDPGS